MDEMLKKTFKNWLYNKRMELNYSQELMAEKCCISARQYCNLEHGYQLPSFKTLISILITLDTDFNTYIASLIAEGYSVTEKDEAI